MNGTPQIWQNWANDLHRWGLDRITASMLDAMGSLTLVGAQLIYLSEPLLKGAVTRERLAALATLLENPQQARDFAAYLREGIWQ